jgi:hypothetical protein
MTLQSASFIRKQIRRALTYIEILIRAEVL